MVLGEPTYDNEHNVVGRNFGMQNVIYIIGIIIIGYLVWSLGKGSKNKSKVMKGGSALIKTFRNWKWWAGMGALVLVLWGGGVGWDKLNN
jgi:hypothetical protein